MNKLLGMNIVITPGIPKMTCSPEFERLQDPDLVHKTNQWMADFFGWTPSVNEILQQGSHLIMRQETFNKLKKHQKDLFFPHSIQPL